MLKNWKQQFDPRFWRADYSYIQRTIRTSGLIAVAFHFPFFALGTYVLGFHESLIIRIFMWLLAVPLVFYPKEKPLTAIQKIHWEFAIHFTLLTFSTYNLLVNDLDQSWTYATTALALMYGLLVTHIPYGEQQGFATL